ncbi:MAG: hypothetical protein KGL39_09240 [Patescibacteria group bacterium]|nr:hypothetical protein [Patescibacteria group bacterium]
MPNERELLSIGPFGGIDPTTPPYFVAPTNFVDLSNILPNHAYGGFSTVPGREKLFTQKLPTAPNGIGCLHQKGLPDTYLFACDSAAQSSVQSTVRLAPEYWYCEGSLTQRWSVVTTGTNGLTATCEMNLIHDYVGLVFASDDLFSHPALTYISNHDYSGITFTFNYAATNMPALSSVATASVVLALTYDDGTIGNYVYLRNYYTGTDYNALITLDFDTIHTGSGPTDPLWAPVKANQIKQMQLGIITSQYDPNGTGPLVGGMQIVTVAFTNMAISVNTGGNPNNAILQYNSLSSPQASYGVADGYDSLPSLMTPQRYLNQVASLGLQKHIDMYVSPSKYYSLHWNSTLNKTELDDTRTICAPASAWFTDFIQRCAAAGIPITLAVSFEILTLDIPSGWDQQDWNGNSGETGYPYPGTTTLARFMNATVGAWLISVWKAFMALTSSSADVTIQIGEPAWWSGENNGPTGATIGPCIFDLDTKNAYFADTGLYAPEITAVVDFGTLTAIQQAYVTWCGGQLGTYTDSVSAALKAVRPSIKVSVLWYADGILAEYGAGLLQNLNLPQSHWKASTRTYDRLENESYNWVNPTYYSDRLASIYLMATGSELSGYLGYAPEDTRYYAGLLTDANSTVYQPANAANIQQAISDAERDGFGLVLFWALSDIVKVGYLPQTDIGLLYAWTAAAGLVLLPTPVPLTPGQRTQFLASGDWMFVNNGADTPLKIDANLNVTYWGIAAPSTAPTLAAGASGLLNGTYYYCETFSNSIQESSQGAISVPFVAASGQVVVTPTATTIDPQVTTRNTYRIGGASGTWTLIHTQPATDLTAWTDNTADSALTGQGLIIFRDAPPAFTAIAKFQGRLFGFGTAASPTQVAWSNYGEPWGFNFNTNTLDGLGDGLGDYAVACGAPNSEQLLLLKARSWAAVVGNSDDTFAVLPGTSIGCVSADSLVVGNSMAMWDSMQGSQLFSTMPQTISDTGFQQSNIKTLLDAMALVDRQSGVSFYYDRMFCISYPTKNVTYVLDTRSMQWYTLSFALGAVYYDPESEVAVVGSNLNAPGQIDQWFASTTAGDLGAPIIASALSRITDAGALEADKQAVYAYVEAPVQNATVTVTLYTNPGSVEVKNSQVISLNVPGTLRHRWELPLGLEGQEFQLQLQTQGLSQVVLHKAAIYGRVVRVHKPAAAGDG